MGSGDTSSNNIGSGPIFTQHGSYGSKPTYVDASLSLATIFQSHISVTMMEALYM